MVLQDLKIKEIIKKGVNRDMKHARKMARKLNMHVTGTGIVSFLKELDTYENAAQKKLREKLVKSNRALFSFIMRPMDKIFTAKGGSVNFNLEPAELTKIKDRITDASDHLDIKRYLKKNVKTAYIIDANAILFVDIDPLGNLEPHIIYTKQILWYEAKGNRIQALIFAPIDKQEDVIIDGIASLKRVQEYRVIDDKQDRIYSNIDGEFEELKSRTITNFFGYVPAMILGDEKDPNKNVFNSQIYDVVDEADLFLRRSSVMNVHELSQLYSRYWSYAQACTKCEGEGHIIEDNTAPTEKTLCTSCGGSGVKNRTNPSDETVLPVPQDGDPIIAPNIAGFVSPDIAISKFYNELQLGFRQEMFQDIWGTTYEQGGKRETATGRYIDAKPVEDKLRDMSYTFERLHQFLLDVFVQALTKNLKYESSVSYGTRYILESPDEILDMMIKLSGKQASEVIKLDLESRYVEAEYQTDSIELKKRKKLMKIEPFPTLQIKDVMLLPIADDDKLRKMYFSQWFSTLTAAQVILEDTERLRSLLDEFIKNKTIKQDETKPV